VLPPLVIRPIRPDDKAALRRGLEHLSPESRHQRFLTPKPRFTSAELRYLTEVDGVDHVALVAVPVDHPDRIVGVARFVRLRDDPEAAEAAVTIADELQGRGLGRELGRRLTDAARARGIRRFTATLLGENVASHRLFEAISERVSARYDGGLEELVAELAAA
jgi:RimJ/RimL family protein N-acetyltransferase